MDRLADGGLGGGGGRRRAARPAPARARAQPLRAGRGVRPGRSRLRGLDGRLPVDAHRAPGPRQLPCRLCQLAALQPRPRDRQRGLLPVDRPGVHPFAAALPAAPGGELAALAGHDRGRAGPRRAHPRRACRRRRRDPERTRRALPRARPERRRRLRRRPPPVLEPALQRLGRPRAGRRGSQSPGPRPRRRTVAGRLRLARPSGPARRGRDRADGSRAERRRARPPYCGEPRPGGRDPEAAPRERLDLRLRQLHGVRGPRPARGRGAGGPRDAALAARRAERRRRLRRGRHLAQRQRHDRRGAPGSCRNRPRGKRHRPPGGGLSDPQPGIGRGLRSDARRQLERSVHVVRRAGTRRRGRGPSGDGARAVVPHAPPASQRQHRLLGRQQPDAGVGDGAGPAGAATRAAARGRGGARARAGRARGSGAEQRPRPRRPRLRPPRPAPSRPRRAGAAAEQQRRRRTTARRTPRPPSPGAERRRTRRRPREAPPGNPATPPRAKTAWWWMARRPPAPAPPRATPPKGCPRGCPSPRWWRWPWRRWRCSRSPSGCRGAGWAGSCAAGPPRPPDGDERASQPPSARAIRRSITRSGTTRAITARALASRPTT